MCNFRLFQFWLSLCTLHYALLQGAADPNNLRFHFSHRCLYVAYLRLCEASETYRKGVHTLFPTRFFTLHSSHRCATMSTTPRRPERSSGYNQRLFGYKPALLGMRSKPRRVPLPFSSNPERAFECPVRRKVGLTKRPFGAKIKSDTRRVPLPFSSNSVGAFGV